MNIIYKNKAEYLASLPTICAWCLKDNTDDFVPVYWNNAIVVTEEGNVIAHRPVHKECKAEQRAYEAYECQKIDADCNDCGYFKREKTGKTHAIGQCLKFNKPTKAYAQFASGHECFVHRKDMGQAHAR
jgi:hypothetical protein